MGGKGIERDCGGFVRQMGADFGQAQTQAEEKLAIEPSGFSQAVCQLMIETGVTEAVARAIVEQSYKQIA